MAKRATLRASDADREQIVDRLRRAAAEGRLTVHELEHRVASALRARTYGELDATVGDLPGSRGGRAPASRRAVRVVQTHPVLLLIAIPIALAVIATLVAITVLWTVLLLIVFLIGRGRPPHRGPWSPWTPYRGAWSYTARYRSGPPRRARYGHGPWL